MKNPFYEEISKLTHGGKKVKFLSSRLPTPMPHCHLNFFIISLTLYVCTILIFFIFQTWASLFFSLIYVCANARQNVQCQVLIDKSVNKSFWFHESALMTRQIGKIKEEVHVLVTVFMECLNNRGRLIWVYSLGFTFISKLVVPDFWKLTLVDEFSRLMLGVYGGVDIKIVCWREMIRLETFVFEKLLEKFLLTLLFRV